MKFKQYIDEESMNVFGYIYLTNELNEVSDDFLLKLQSVGKKMGIKVRKSKTFQNQINKAGKGVLHLMKLVLDYSLHDDIFDIQAGKKLEQEMKSQFSKVKKEDVISFIVNIDKSFIGITSIPRHILQNVLGISITSFDNYVSDVDYIEKNMGKIISSLRDLGAKEEEIMAKRIYSNITGHQLE